MPKWACRSCWKDGVDRHVGASSVAGMHIESKSVSVDTNSKAVPKGDKKSKTLNVSLRLDSKELSHPHTERRMNQTMDYSLTRRSSLTGDPKGNTSRDFYKSNIGSL
jgi:hypothetical protein